MVFVFVLFYCLAFLATFDAMYVFMTLIPCLSTDEKGGRGLKLEKKSKESGMVKGHCAPIPWLLIGHTQLSRVGCFLGVFVVVPKQSEKGQRSLTLPALPVMPKPRSNPNGAVLASVLFCIIA